MDIEIDGIEGNKGEVGRGGIDGGAVVEGR